MASLEPHNEFKAVGEECSEDCNVSVNERESERYNFENSKMFKSALKKHSSRPEKKQLRVTFSEAVTMFSEEFSEQQITTMSPTDLSLNDMYEPPPQYQDWLDIKPPTEYQDTLEDITLILEREFGSVVLNSESLNGHDFQVINNNCEAKESSNGEITTAHAFSKAVKTSNVTETQTDISAHPIIMKTSTLCDTYLDKETEDENKCVTLSKAKENNAISETENKSVIFQVSENISVLPSNITSNYCKKRSLESKTPAVLPGLLKFAVKPLKLEKQSPNLLSSPKQLNKDLAHPRIEDDNCQVQLSSLTSVREIDSDSSASSQETIIMMSSEASRDSDKQNRIVSNDMIGKTNKCLTSSVQGSKSTISFSSFSAERENEGIGGLSKEHSNGICRTSSQIRQTIEKNALRRRLQKKTKARKKNVEIDNFKSTLKSDSSLVEKLRWLTSEISEEQNGEELDEKITNEYSFVDVKNHEFDGDKQPEIKTLVADQYFQPIKRPLPTIIRKKHPIHWQRGFQKRPLSLGKEYEDFSSREKRLVSMMVPGEVCNWTIRSQYEKNELNTVTRNENTHSLPISCRSENTGLYKPHVSHPGFLQGTRRGTTLDELEQFVKEDLLRIERIRKQFSLSEDLSYGFSRRPSVKGIRPRFGSTMEIMKQMQLQLQPPILMSSRNVESHATRSNFDVDNESYSRLLTKSRKSAVSLPRVTEEEEDNRTNIIPQTNHTNLSPKRNDVCSGNGFSNHQQTQKTQEEIHAHFYKNGFTPLNQLDTLICKEQKCSFFENKRVMPEDASSSSKVVSDLVCHSIPTYGQSNPVEETGLIYYALNV